MKPTLGWTMLSREEMRQVEHSLANSEQDTRDEIGFLLIHQGFADRFFPGTSVLHTRIRYALFVPWLFQRAAFIRRRGSDLDATIRYLLIELAIRLKQIGREPRDVIGGDKLGQITSQPPDRAYWSAMRAWGLLLRDVDSRSEALRRLQASGRSTALDDDGGRLDDAATEVFASLPRQPDGWNNPSGALHFKMPRSEREFLRRKLQLLTRPGDGSPALLARLVEAGDTFPETTLRLPPELDARADAADREALGVARDAAALAAIGRAVYGALVEELVARDGGTDERNFRDLLPLHFADHGEAAARCNLYAAEELLPNLPAHVKVVLRESQAYARAGKPEDFASLRSSYQIAEVRRKSVSRARLIDTERAALRRAEWDPLRHNTTPLHYRWKIVRDMLADLSHQP
jgi:Family of unknown function (DUF6361)